MLIDCFTTMEPPLSDVFPQPSFSFRPKSYRIIIDRRLRVMQWKSHRNTYSSSIEFGGQNATVEAMVWGRPYFNRTLRTVKPNCAVHETSSSNTGTRGAR